MGTTLHLSTNNGTGNRILCGAAKHTTYLDLVQGTDTRTVDRAFYGPRHPEFGSACTECARINIDLGAPTLPSFLAI